MSNEKVAVVQIDGLVLLKIIKHCKENVPEGVTGQLLGLDIGKSLEVTNCFPFPDGDDEDDDSYQLDMMKQLRTVNVDYNTVGWYQSAFLGSFLDANIVETQYSYQQHIPNSVCVVYDPFRTADGYLALKAYRLTEAFMGLFASQSFGCKAFSSKDMDSRDIFEEIPIQVHNAHLVHGFLYELREDKSMSCDYDRLNLFGNPYLQKNLEIMANCIDDFAQEQSKFQFHQRQAQRVKQQQQQYVLQKKEERQRAESLGQDVPPQEDLSKNALFKAQPEPSRLETFLISNQIQHYADHLIATATASFNKLFIIEGLQVRADGPFAQAAAALQ
jgi:translation initiation factor 3 subunit H